MVISNEESRLEEILLSDPHENEEFTRVVVETTIELKCSMIYIDFEGRSDGEAMKKIISSIRPQEVILVHGSESATDNIAEFCRNTLQLRPALVHTPSIDETVDCTKERHIYQAIVRDSLVSSLRFYKVRDYELAWINAEIGDEASSMDALLHHHTTTTTERETSDETTTMAVDNVRLDLEAPVPVLIAPRTNVPDHPTVFVNEPKLSEVKTLFLRLGLNAEFFSGVLIVNNCVAVKRSEAGKLMIEGTISDTYFKVHDILFSQFAIL